MSVAFKHSKGHHDHSNRPTECTAETKIEFNVKNGGHLENWVPYCNSIWLHNSKTQCQQPIDQLGNFDQKYQLNIS